ncbi:MAG: amidohydrolase family protein [Chloroflexota bacterium]
MTAPAARSSSADRGQERVLEGRLIEDGGSARITIRDGVVAAIARDSVAAEDVWIGPGWLDLQVNGFAGHDPNGGEASPEIVTAMVQAMWPSGIAASCITICTESEARIIRSLRAVADACDADPLIAASIIGIHVEGPHIAREDGPRGAHPLAHIRPPDVAEYRRWQEAARGRIRIITVSPEYHEAIAYIRAIVDDGVVASIGHTAATGDQIRAAVDAGARWSTHLGNGAHALIPRHPNYIWDQLSEDRLSAGFIFDGHHLPPSIMKPLIRAKGVERSILVSDAVSFAGLPPGIYELFNGADVELLASGRLELHGTPYLAGAVAMLPVCVSNAVRYAGVTLAEAVGMVTANPARLLRLPPLDGRESVRVGAAANLTLFRQSLADLAVEVVMTVVAGHPVYAAKRA